MEIGTFRKRRIFSGGTAEVLASIFQLIRFGLGRRFLGRRDRKFPRRIWIGDMPLSIEKDEAVHEPGFNTLGEGDGCRVGSNRFEANDRFTPELLQRFS